jgi:hypothetical protein
VKTPGANGSQGSTPPPAAAGVPVDEPLDLTRMYQSLPDADAEPDAALDARIQDAARRAIAPRRITARTHPVRPTPWWRRLAIPLSVAATVMLSATLVLTGIGRGQHERHAGPADHPQVAAAPPAAASAPQRAPAVASSSPDQAASVPPVAVASASAPAAPAATAAPAAASSFPAPPSGAASPGWQVAPPAAVIADATPRIARQSDRVDALPSTIARNERASSEPAMAPSSNVAASSAAQEALSKSTSERRPAGAVLSRERRPTSERFDPAWQAPTADERLVAIEAMVERGDREGARAALKALRARFPDAVIPERLRPLL